MSSIDFATSVTRLRQTFPEISDDLVRELAERVTGEVALNPERLNAAVSQYKRDFGEDHCTVYTKVATSIVAYLGHE